ncbi:MAG: hypothetical protein Q8P67_28705, partial [archaeon]|nr:hypothetical protein [archaeon]
MASSFPYFQQPHPEITTHPYLDPALREILLRKVPSDVLDRLDADLIPFGDRTLLPHGDIAKLSEAIRLPSQVPTFTKYSAFGEYKDELWTCPAWQELHRIAAREGLIAIGYERASGEYSRLHQFLKLLAFAPVSGVVSCPLAMTDGAARLIEQLRLDPSEPGNAEVTAELRQCFQRFTTRCPDSFWTSGQWMTERTGGSDLGRT